MKTGNLSVLGLVTGLTKDEVGLGNVANELQLYASQLSTDGTMADDSSSLVPSQSAVISYVSSQIGDITGALTFKGTIDLSGNPDYPAGAVGDVYMVSVAGNIGGALGVSLTVGDLVLCITANAGGAQAVVGSDWDTIQLSINGIVVGPSSSINNDFAIFNGTSGSVIQDSGLSLSIDGTMVSNSDSLIPSQKSVVTYVNSLGFLTSITSGDVTTALGYTPVESVSGTSGQISATGSTNVTLALVTTAVTPGSYTLSSITVDAYGRLTAASSHTLTSSDVTTALGYIPVAPASMESGENNIIAFLDGDGNLVDSHLLVTTDGTLSADSDSAIPTEKAVKTYVDNAVGGLSSQTPWTDDEDAATYNLYNLTSIKDPSNSQILIDTTYSGFNNNAIISFDTNNGVYIGNNTSYGVVLYSNSIFIQNADPGMGLSDPTNNYILVDMSATGQQGAGINFSITSGGAISTFTQNNTLDDGAGNMLANSLTLGGSGAVLTVSGSTSLDSGAISTNGTGTLNLSALVATGNVQASTLTISTLMNILTTDSSGNIAIGYESVNSAGHNGVALGPYTNVNSNYGVAIGCGAVVSAINGIAIGENCVASGISSIAIGGGATASNENEIQFATVVDGTPVVQLDIYDNVANFQNNSLTANGLNLPNDPGAGAVLTSDGSGNATWQATIATGVTSFNTRTGAVTLTSGDVTTALGYTPVSDNHIQRGTFTDGDLVSGNVLVITHNLALTAPFAVVVSVFDNNGNQILPDAIVGATNSVDVDLSSYGSLTGTWGWVLIG